MICFMQKNAVVLKILSAFLHHFLRSFQLAAAHHIGHHAAGCKKAQNGQNNHQPGQQFFPERRRARSAVTVHAGSAGSQQQIENEQDIDDGQQHQQHHPAGFIQVMQAARSQHDIKIKIKHQQRDIAQSSHARQRINKLIVQRHGAEIENAHGQAEGNRGKEADHIEKSIPADKAQAPEAAAYRQRMIALRGRIAGKKWRRVL